MHNDTQPRSLTRPEDRPQGTIGQIEQVTTGTMGMTLLILSLSALFATTMVGYFIIVIRFGKERNIYDPLLGEVSIDPPELPALPVILFASTAIIILSSVTLHIAKISIRKGSQGGLKFGLFLTLLLGAVFLATQTVAWLQWFESASGVIETKYNRFAFAGFLVLSATHAVHLIFGVGPLMVTCMRAMKGRYTSESYNGIRHLALYWHFLDVVWIVMFASLLLFM